MVGSLDPLHLPIRRHPLQYRLHQTRLAERIARSVEAEHGNLDGGQMRITQLIGLARWMERVREQQQSVTREPLGGEHRAGASAHRTAADDERLWLQLFPCPRDDR